MGEGIVRTCVASLSELFETSRKDRKFEISGGGEHTFRLYAYDIDGSGNECGSTEDPKREVNLILEDDSELTPVDGSISSSATSFYFQNIASVDCLVEVRITEKN